MEDALGSDYILVSVFLAVCCHLSLISHGGRLHCYYPSFTDKEIEVQSATVADSVAQDSNPGMCD